MPRSGGSIQQQRHGRHQHSLRVALPAVLLLLVTGLRFCAYQGPSGPGTMTGGSVTALRAPRSRAVPVEMVPGQPRASIDASIAFAGYRGEPGAATSSLPPEESDGPLNPKSIEGSATAEAGPYGDAAIPAMGITDRSILLADDRQGNAPIENAVQFEDTGVADTSLDPTGPAPGASKSLALSEPASAYEDQYLLVGDLSEYEQDWPYAEQPFGRRRLGAELMYYNSDDDFFGDDVERGARVYWSRETESWGVIDLEAQYSDLDSSFVGRQTVGGEAVVTLRQSAMPVSAEALLDTTLGHQRIPSSSLLHGGYRYRLPTSAMLGLSGELTGTDNRIRFATGNVGAYRGVRIPQFEETGGRLTTLAYEQRLNPQLEIGTELMNLSNDDDLRDHTSLLLGTRYQAADNAQEHAARLLADNDGNIALWTDSRHGLGESSTLRYGAFYFDPELVWADLPISNDQMGFYLRADTGNARYNLSGGYDYFETGIDSAAVASSDSHALFLAGSLKIRRALSLGFNAGLTNRSFTSLNGDDQVISRINTFANIGSPLGNARIEIFSHELDSEFPGNRRARTGVGASFNWRLPQKISLTTELRAEQNEDQRGNTRRTELSALARYDLFDNLSLGLNSALYRTRGDTYSQDDGLSLSADARWTFLPDWYASLSVSRNRADFQVADYGFLDVDGTAGHSSFWLTVRYERRTGQPFPTFGRTHNGLAGTGTISGQVFFDLNRDFVRQPSEEVAVGAVVLLDGRYETRTDEQGRYAFAPVPTGEHEVSVLVEELPLPWGLDDETPRRVVSRLRENSAVDFPLVVME